MANKVKSGKIVKVAKVIASGIKWVCPIGDCAAKCKVRQLRAHMKSFHKWTGSSFSCKIVGCEWTCSKDMHFIANHSKSCHPTMADVPYELVEATGVGLDQEGLHSQSCFSDVNWHTSCIVKLARSKKSKA